jgi:hypothetical protein
VNVIVAAVENPASGVRVLGVPEIRGGSVQSALMPHAQT